MPFITCFLYLLLLVYALPAHSQELLFRNMDEISLPSQESYNIMQDSKGYIWIGTEAGLCRYNGHSLEVFNEKNGLPEQSCYVVKEDKYGVLWIATAARRILNFSNDSLYEAPISRNFRKYVAPNSSVHVYLMQFEGDSAYLQAPYASFRASLQSGLVDSLPAPPAEADYYFFMRDGMLVPWKVYRKQPKRGKYDVEICIETGSEKKRITLPYRKHHPVVWRVMTAANQYGTKMIAFDDVLIRLNNDLSYKVYYLPNMILSLYCDPDGGFWAGTYKKGVFYYPDIAQSDRCFNSLRGFSVTGICQDREKAIWCTTLEEGVFYSRSREMVHYSNVEGLNKKAELLRAVNGRVYATSSAGKILRPEGDKANDYAVQPHGTYPVSDLLPLGDGWLVCAKDMLAQTDRQFRVIKNINIKGTAVHAGGRQLLQVPGGRIFVVGAGSLYELQDSAIVERGSPGSYSLLCIAPGNREDALLAGTKTGLYRFDTRKFRWTRINGINDYVPKIQQGAGGETWVMTRRSGMFLVKGDNLVPAKWLKQLKTDRFFDVKEDRYHVLWIGCARGLVRIEGWHHQPRMQLYNVTNGLAANEVYDIATDSNYLYVSTVKGISYFPLQADLSNNIAPPVFIRSVFTGDQQLKYSMNRPLVLSWKDPVRVKVDGLCYKQGETPRLQYILKGQDDVLHSHDGNEIVLGRLSPGSYELQVYALNSDGRRSTQPAIMQFRVRPPFWQTWWFITCAVLVCVIILRFLVSRKIAQVRKKEQEMSRINHLIAEYRLTALQAQMNPHFIFNAINSIQTYILDNQPQVAYDYLAKFSRLIRLVLYHAKDRTLTLEQELEMLRTYTELEQLRFSNKFDVVLHVDAAINTDRVELPPMLLQPYVENAIWHGLLPLKDSRKGILKISITKKDEGLRLVIEDNGVGRTYREKETQAGHRSLGMMLNTQRMELLSHMPEYEGATIRVTDLHDTSGKPSGTRVEIDLLLMAEATL